MSSVLMLFVPFCLFVNRYLKEGRVTKLRANFNRVFKGYYEALLPNVKNINLEHVFKGGIQPITEGALLQYSIGALLHDIGKLHDIDYFEGDEGYDRSIIIKHVPVSYKMLSRSGEFSKDVAILGALHHEYYNDPAGYSITQRLFPAYNPYDSTIKYCMSSELPDLGSSISLAYFPAKILEIVDIFDALIDQYRRYREIRYSPEEALLVMKSTFIDYSLKIDPVLFSIFLEFIRYYGIVDDVSFVEGFIF